MINQIKIPTGILEKQIISRFIKLNGLWQFRFLLKGSFKSKYAELSTLVFSPRVLEDDL